MFSVWKHGLSKTTTLLGNSLPSNSVAITSHLTSNHILFNAAASSTISRSKKDVAGGRKKDLVKRNQQKEHQKRMDQKKAALEQRNKEKLAMKRASKDSELDKPKPPSIEKLYPKKKVTGKYIAELAKTPSLAEFVNTSKNIDVSKLSEQTGYFGLKHFKDASSMRDSLVLAKGRVDDLVSSIEKGEDVSRNTLELTNLRFSYLSSLKAFIQLHPFEDLAVAAQEIHDNFSQFFAQRALTNEKFGKATQSLVLDTPLANEVRNIYGVESSREKFTEAKEDFEKRVKELNDYIQTHVNTKVRGSMRIYELPEAHSKSLKMEVQKKKKFILLNLEKDLEAILTNVSEESLRTDLFDEATKKFFTGSADNEFNSKVASAIDASNAFAKTLGYQSFVEMKIATVNMSNNNVPKVDDFVKVIGQLKEQIDIKKEVEKLSELKITRMTDPVLKRCFYNKSKQTAEDLKLFTPGFDIMQLSNLHYNRVRVNYLPSDIQNYMSLSSVLDGLTKTVASQAFGVEVVPEKLAPSETWSPLNIKKLNVVSNGKVVGHIYLDLFEREKTQHFDAYASDKAKLHPISGENGLKSAVIQMNLGDHIYSVSNTLNLKQFKSLSGAFGQALFHILSQSSSAVSETNLLSKVVRKVFERLPQNTEFLLANLSHRGSKQPIPEEYARQLSTTPTQYPLELVQQMVYSLFELEVFKPIDASQSTPIEILSSIESRFCKPYTQLIPNISFFSKRLFNLESQPYYSELYTEIVAAHIFASGLSGSDMSKFSSSLKSVLSTEAATKPLESITKLLGADRPDATFFAKEIQ
ncbi:predicted protein [Naegleria gruberi]|uniref:Predicted protein n=1 Tax=Naegleria gruberi TaxID=5762 RepID=D2VLK2_NAEGR|nr:uncharacterized protein NAEGRDRAFT_80457 [Naegleria gruberi]EFC42404.1 predicted protein [Naegleria gruberi]|eukprot:XP_002675148.1 predicted protein [Naegleria gruberi strain NEG-M]